MDRNTFFEVEPDSFENASVSEDGKNRIVNSLGISPQEIEPVSHVNSLQSFFGRSCTELGWIENHGICRSLEGNLENMERQLDRRNINAALGSWRRF